MTNVTPPAIASAQYASRIEAVLAQRIRLRGEPQVEAWSGGPAVDAVRADPHRPLDLSLQLLASYLQADDVLIDVGGGAGRIALALAARCREVINVDSSPVMLRAFASSARDANILNARSIAAHWPDIPDEFRVEADVAVAVNITYFVRDIVPFIESLEAAARRRVIIDLWTCPPVARNGALFALVFGEEEVLVPTHRELLAVLWHLGIVPEVRVVPGVAGASSRRANPRTHEEVVQSAVDVLGREQWALGRLSDQWGAHAYATIEAHFDELFASTADGYRARWVTSAREILITWPSGDR